jgi:hypothetical protein
VVVERSTVRADPASRASTPTTLRLVKTPGLCVLLAAPLLLTSCSGSSGGSAPKVDPQVAASAPVPGVTLPPDSLLAFVPTPAEVPAGMVPVLTGSGPRDLATIAGYSGTGATATAAAAKLTSHGFVSAYVGQYDNPSSKQVLSVVVTSFSAATGATADYTDDLAGAQGTAVPTPTLGEASAVTIQNVPGAVPSQLVLVRFRRDTHVWLLAYKAPTADASLATALAKTLLDRTATS